jgi:hypothetical protein
MGSGVVYLLSGLGGDSMAVRPVPGLMAPTSGMTQTISPSVVMATRYQAPNVINMANDVIQLYIVPSAFNYGASTESTSAYAMHSGVEDRLPQTGNMPYFVTLESAPPANPAWLMLSWQRSSLYILPDVEFLLDQEQFIGVYSWYTSYDGTAALPMPVPSDPDLTGFAWHAQWLVLDADQPRGFQLSDGLTIAF